MLHSPKLDQKLAQVVKPNENSLALAWPCLGWLRSRALLGTNVMKECHKDNTCTPIDSKLNL